MLTGNFPGDVLSWCVPSELQSSSAPPWLLLSLPVDTAWPYTAFQAAEDTWSLFAPGPAGKRYEKETMFSSRIHYKNLHRVNWSEQKGKIWRREKKRRNSWCPPCAIKGHGTCMRALFSWAPFQYANICARLRTLVHFFITSPWGRGGGGFCGEAGFVGLSMCMGTLPVFCFCFFFVWGRIQTEESSVACKRKKRWVGHEGGFNQATGKALRVYQFKEELDIRSLKQKTKKELQIQSKTQNRQGSSAWKWQHFSLAVVQGKVKHVWILLVETTAQSLREYCCNWIITFRH